MKNSSKIVFEQERDFSDKINITFNFVTANFKPLCLSLLYPKREKHPEGQSRYIYEALFYLSCLCRFHQ